MKFWRSTKSKLVAKLVDAIFETPQLFKLQALDSDDLETSIQERVEHFDEPEGSKAMNSWLCKHEYNQDSRSLARLGQTVDEFWIEPNLVKFATEIAKVAAGI